MISIDANKLKMSLANLKRLRKTVQETGDGQFRQKLYYLFSETLKVSPQFSGDFVSNWRLVVDGNLGSYKRWHQKDGMDKNGRLASATTSQNIHQAGDMEAITPTMARAVNALKGVTLKAKVHFINMTDLHTPDGVRMVSPTETMFLRPENVIPGPTRIESYIKMKAQEHIPAPKVKLS